MAPFFGQRRRRPIPSGRGTLEQVAPGVPPSPLSPPPLCAGLLALPLVGLLAAFGRPCSPPPSVPLREGRGWGSLLWPRRWRRVWSSAGVGLVLAPPLRGGWGLAPLRSPFTFMFVHSSRGEDAPLHAAFSLHKTPFGHSRACALHKHTVSGGSARACSRVSIWCSVCTYIYIYIYIYMHCAFVRAAH